ncbi:hypothetical protein PO909_001206, partial [Leuciscus waleckii]
FWRFLQCCFSVCHSDCPVQLNPQRVVVKYGGPVSVDCSTSVPRKGMGWEASEGPVPMTTDRLITWRVSELREWDIEPSCYIHYNKTQCTVNLPVTIYKTPDSVSISTVNHNGPMMEGNQYELQCDVLNVAPVQYLTVNWYKGQTLVDQTIFTDTIKTPVSKTSKLLIRPDRADDGAQYWCEAKLELEEEGPQPPPTAPSEHLSITVYYSDCPVQLNPQRVVVKFGGPVSVDCSTYVSHKGMGWESSEGPVPMTTDRLITWRVSELREWGIEPSCFINHNKSQCTVNLPVTIYKTPDSVSISTVNHNGPMMEGNQYELQCDVLNVAPVQYLTVNWYKGQTLVNQTIFTDTIKTPVNKTSKLLIRPDRADDGAQYWCEAKLELGEEGPRPPPTNTSEHLNITVYYEPKINHCQDWSPTTGTSLNSYPNSYSLVGNPHPDISWKRESSLSQLNASILLNTYDSDQYEIIASNEHGYSTCIINITVEYPPKLNCSEGYEVKEKTPFQPPCVANGLPKPDVSFYKNGKLIELPYNPKWNDSGLYQLTASNKHGTVNSAFVLTILYAPVFHASQDKFVVAEDSNITLECNSSGNPEPKMSWSFENKTISTGRRRITLNIKKATSTSAGVYTCSAMNQFGHHEKNFEVEIRGNPPNYIPIITVVALVVALLVIIITLLICLWIKKKSTGSYQIQPVNQYEMRPLNNGGKC